MKPVRHAMLTPAIAASLLLIAACGKKDEPAPPPAPQAAAPAPAPAPAPIPAPAAAPAPAPAPAAAQAEQALTNAAAAVADATKAVAGSVADGAAKAVEATKDAAAGAVAAARETAASVADAAKDSTAGAVDATKAVAGKAVEATKEAAAGVAEATRETVARAAEGASDMAAKAASAVGSAAAPTGQAVNDAAAKAAAAVAAATATAAAVVTGKSDQKPYKVAFAYVGPVGDGGWTFAHDRARKEMEAHFAGRVTTTFVESVPENADAERVLRDLAAQGNDMIFGTTFGYMETMLRLAKEFPEVKWEHATGFKSSDNMRPYDVRAYQGAYLAGIIAGKMTKTDTLGFVASVPIPEVVRNINAYTLGAQSVNPAVRTKVVWVNKWFDPGRESEAAQSLINGGADVLLQNTDSSAPLQVAERAGKYGFGWDSDMTAYGPKAHLASSIINWAPYYKKAVGQGLDGAWKVETNWWGVKEGAIDLVSISDVVPADVRALVEEKKKAIASGDFKIWKGPMLTSEDKEILPTGAVADDAFISSIMFYVKGVEGKIPTGN